MGSAGKESREKEIRHVSNLNEADHLGSFIRWRDDCEIFATSVPTPKGRRIRIYSRDGSHISSSEPDIELLGPLSWRGNGLLSALSIDVDSRHKICHIERNGLKHGTFGGNTIDDKVTSFEWNSLGTLFLVVFESGRLDLWRSDNWHFYRQISTNKGVTAAWWDKNKNDDIWILTKNRLYLKSVESVTVRSESTVALQNTNKIGWTKYREAAYPPPMFGYEVQSNSSVFALSDDNKLVTAENDALVVYSIDEDENVQSEKIACEESNQFEELTSFGESIFAVYDSQEASGSKIAFIQDGKCSTFDAELDFDPIFVSQLVATGKNQFLAIGRKNGEMEKNVSYTVLRGTIENELELEFLNEHDKPVKHLCQCQNTIAYMVGGQLYIGLEKVKTESILSLAVHDNFIICTSTKHELLIWSAPDFGKKLLFRVLLIY